MLLAALWSVVGILVVAVAALGIWLFGFHTLHKTQGLGAEAATSTTAPDATTQSADAAGLVPAEHSECDFGSKLLNYLLTGDNGGDPSLDQKYANDVGESLPQARADVDTAIKQCDAAIDQKAADESAAVEASRESEQSAAAQASADAASLAARRSACAGIGGRYSPQYQWCSSNVEGNPSGKPGADCSNARAALDGDAVDQSSLENEKEWYPGCFP